MPNRYAAIHQPKVTRYQLLLSALGFLILAIVYYHWTWSPVLSAFGGDNANYILYARYLSPYADTSPAADYFATQSHFPPLYPFVLAVFGGAESILIAHVITTTIFLLALIVFISWMTNEGLPLSYAAGIAIFFALLPGTYFHALSVHSENLYLLFTFLGTLFIALWERRGSTRWLWVAALCIGLTTLIRGTGIAAVAALLVYLFVRKRDTNWRPAVLVFAPAVLWKLFGFQAERSYFDYLILEYGASPLTKLLENIGVQSEILFYAWTDIFFYLGHHVVPFLGVLGLICILGVLYRVYLKKFDAYYVVAYLAIIFVWPFPDEAKRLLLVIVPFLLYSGIYILGVAGRAESIKKYAGYSVYVLTAIALVIVSPDLMFTIKRFSEPLPEMLATHRRQNSWYGFDKQAALNDLVLIANITANLKTLDKTLPKEECIYSIKPSVTALYSRRLSISPPAFSVDQDEFERTIRAGRCSYFYMIPIQSPSYKSKFYPLERARDLIDVLSVVETGMGGDLPVAALLGKYRHQASD